MAAGSAAGVWLGEIDVSLRVEGGGGGGCALICGTTRLTCGALATPPITDWWGRSFRAHRRVGPGHSPLGGISVCTFL